MMILMGGMQGIPAELYEAANVDGATWWQKERRITIPMLRRNIALSLIISVIGSFLAFNQFYILTQGGPGTSTEPDRDVDLPGGVHRIYHLGYATAGAIALVIVVVHHQRRPVLPAPRRRHPPAQEARMTTAGKALPAVRADRAARAHRRADAGPPGSPSS